MIKDIWLYSVKYTLRVGLFFYYRRIHIYGKENIPKDKPVLILGNHQSALMDALFIVTYIDRFIFFLTRASVFKKSFVDTILRSLNMIPVYRIRDGWKTISKNNEVFDFISSQLGHGRTVAVFPEGSHNLVRRVRPLSKGFTRIVFGTLDTYPEKDLQLVQAGVNYIKPTAFGDSVALYYGQPIPARPYQSLPSNEKVAILKRDVHSAISKLTTHIDEDGYDDTLARLIDLNVDFLDPSSVNTCIAQNFENCKKGRTDKLQYIKQFLKLLLIINLLPPYLLWKLWITPKIKEPEFIGTFRFAVALVLVPLYLLLIGGIIAYVFTFYSALYYIALVLILDLLAVKL